VSAANHNLNRLLDKAGYKRRLMKANSVLTGWERWGLENWHVFCYTENIFCRNISTSYRECVKGEIKIFGDDSAFF